MKVCMLVDLNASIKLIFLFQQHRGSQRKTNIQKKGLIHKNVLQNTLNKDTSLNNVKWNLWLLWHYSNILSEASALYIILHLRVAYSHFAISKHGLNFALCKQSCPTVPVKSHPYLCVLEVMSPEGSDLVLATHIPHSEADIFIFYRLHIETYTWKRTATDPFSIVHTAQRLKLDEVNGKRSKGPQVNLI